MTYYSRYLKKDNLAIMFKFNDKCFYSNTNGDDLIAISNSDMEKKLDLEPDWKKRCIKDTEYNLMFKLMKCIFYKA